MFGPSAPDLDEVRYLLCPLLTSARSRQGLARRCPRTRCRGGFRVRWPVQVFRPGLQSGSHDRGPLVEQISTAPLAYAPEPQGFDMLCCLAPGKPACYGVRVPRLAALPQAPSDDPSRRRPCRKLVIRVVHSVDGGSLTGDFHPTSTCPCRAYTTRCNGLSAFAADRWSLCCVRLPTLGGVCQSWPVTERSRRV